MSSMTHGLKNYRRGCRCEVCVLAARAWSRVYRRELKKRKRQEFEAKYGAKMESPK